MALLIYLKKKKENLTTYLVYPVMYCFEVCIGASLFICYVCIQEGCLANVPRDGLSLLHVLTVWALFPPVLAAMILRPSGLHYNAGLIQCSELCFLTLGTWYSIWMTVWYPPCIPDSHSHRITSTKCHINTVVSPDDGHIVA
jgi:hypothetical protein